MFDFENLEVYKKAKDLNSKILHSLRLRKNIDNYLKDQLKRASLSIVLNIAEGSGKFSKADKRYFYTTARGSTYECVALYEVLTMERLISQDEFKMFYTLLEEISKMLFRLIQSEK